MSLLLTTPSLSLCKGSSSLVRYKSKSSLSLVTFTSSACANISSAAFCNQNFSNDIFVCVCQWCVCKHSLSHFERRGARSCSGSQVQASTLFIVWCTPVTWCCWSTKHVVFLSLLSLFLPLVVILYIFLFSLYFAQEISFGLKVRHEKQNNIPSKVTKNGKKCLASWFASRKHSPTPK